MEYNIGMLRAIAQDVLDMKTSIGDGTEDNDLSNRLLENAPDDTMTGQAYEDLAIAFYALNRCYETIIDIAGNMERP